MRESTVRRTCATALALGLLAATGPSPAARGQTPGQPRVAPGPSEPDWVAILEGVYGLKMFDDLLNPVKTSPAATPGLFKKAGPGTVTFRPEMALGLEAVIRGGTYSPGGGDKAPETRPLWSYRYRNSGRDVETGSNLPPPLLEGSETTFDPGDGPFGLYVANDQFQDSVFSEPSMVAAHNPRLAAQPYKAMVYPYRDPKTRELVPNSYLIGWEYSTNDDFQDVVCRIDNVVLIPAGGQGGSKP